MPILFVCQVRKSCKLAKSKNGEGAKISAMFHPVCGFATFPFSVSNQGGGVMLRRSERVQALFIELDRATLCINCETVFRNEGTSVACPRCGSTIHVPLSRWLSSIETNYDKESYDAMLRNLQRDLPNSQAA